MMKVKVNEQIFKYLEEINSLYPKGEKPTLTEFIFDFVNENESYRMIMNRNKFTDDDLINAYKYGWEVEYEFQVGDVIKWYDFEGRERADIVSDIKHGNLHLTSGKHDWMPKEKCILISKAENREDLKQC